MEWLFVLFDWVCASPWERLLLFAETVALVIGALWTWLHRNSLKADNRSLKSDNRILKEGNHDLKEDNKILSAKMDQMLSMMEEMRGENEAKQNQTTTGNANSC